ncbi:BTB/POZ domain-containing protein 2-like [Dreissena polymorpha]|uniref:BTB domain-containing protein n=1 Tax=Dreissena polymorpha TaxID=45954 RepID=A0A9D4F6J1_DREPO|nr:BTB/POZ domain-containing protein 2-like [Dreissena polymorpha]KAH3792672.1 hypothetical protein DPMN_146171 [Dreissena polymorpha]
MAINWQHSASFAYTNLKMLENEDLCDVTFEVGNEHKQIKCHKFILASRSSVFRKMFDGSLGEPKATILIPDVTACFFETLLRYLYSGAVEMNVETGMSVMYTAKKFDVPEFECHCRTFLNDNIDVNNVCTIMDQAIVFDEVELKTKSLEFIMDKTLSVLNSSSCIRMSKSGLAEVLKQDMLTVNECELYNVCIRWASQRCRDAGKQDCDENIRQVLGDELISLIRFPTMTLEEFTDYVATGSVLDKDELLNVYRSIVKNENVSKFISRSRFDLTGFKTHLFIRCKHINSGWGYGGLQDGISFKLSADCVLSAVDMFLPIAEGSVNGVLELLEGSTVIHAQNVKLFYTKGVKHLLVNLTKRVYLRSVNDYSIRQRMKGRPTFYCGSTKQRSIWIDGVTMTFSDLKVGESDAGTDMSSGQFYGFELLCKAQSQADQLKSF